jgi:hypothetical protein
LIARHLMVAAVAGLALPAFADNCAKLSEKTMCITATNSNGGSWTMNAVFGTYAPDMEGGSATIGGNPASYRCVGNNFAKVTIDDTTFDRYVWIAKVGSKAKVADGTGSSSPTEMYFRYKAVEGACPAAN